MTIVVHKYTTKSKINQCMPGLADFLRGTLTLMSLCEYFNYKFYLDTSHPIFNYLKNNYSYFTLLDNSIEIVECIPPISYEDIKIMIINLFKSGNNFSIITNSFEIIPIQDDTKNTLKDILSPSNIIEIKIKTFLNKTIDINYPYIVCHFRLDDRWMGKDKNLDDTVFNNLLNNINSVIEKNKNIPRKNIIVISDCYSFKNRLKNHNISMTDGYPIHLGLTNNESSDDIEKTMIDFFLMTKSQHIYSFGIHSSSGFSNIVNLLFNIPLIHTQIPIIN